jgi:hypothetical protein
MKVMQYTDPIAIEGYKKKRGANRTLQKTVMDMVHDQEY